MYVEYKKNINLFYLINISGKQFPLLGFKRGSTFYNALHYALYNEQIVFEQYAF